MFYGKFDDRDREEFQQALKLLQKVFGRVYAQDNLIALQRTAGFLQDESFLQAFKGQAQTRQERSLAWRLHTLTWASKHCLSVEGDFVECGVYKGFSMAVVAAYLQFEAVDKTLYLYDTFAGIPAEFNSEARSNAVYEHDMAGDRDAIYRTVQNRFEPYPNVRIVRGTVPESFAEACPEKIAFLHLDMNSSKSEIAALEVLFDRMSSGSAIVFDDYGWSGYVRQKLAEDAFMGDRGLDILELPTGQGLLLVK
ncbi:TylF/MycF/NovP-related O-methyltransferase [Synechococcus sp. PCC 7336]|uniref:TylF/MycF/NovP-related O-methyltransferase n=1 Tax=Synechococcus sp. PCC 7336 TaxID=195250 RepID=UPI0003493699|nr:TylF/MycF/NovP-related O-methyltransferase [Synechococcus sp. PCC 7336]